MKRKQILAGLLTVTLVISSLMGCGSTDETATDSGVTEAGDSGTENEEAVAEEKSGEEENTSSEAKYEGVEITWSVNAIGDAQKEAFDQWTEKLIAEVKEKTGATLNIEMVAWGDYLNKHLASIASGTGPDIIQMGSCSYPVVMDADGLVPLDDKMDLFGGEDAYYPSAMFYGKYNDHIYALPWGGGARNYYYRKDIFEKYGLEEPGIDWTWEDLNRDVEILTEKMGGPAFLPCGTTHDASYVFWFTLEAEDGKILSDDYSQTEFNSDAGLKAIRHFADLYEKGCIPATFVEYGMDDCQASFVNGEVALAIGSDSWMPALEQAGINDVYGVVPPPKGENGTFTNLIIPSCLGVTSYSKNQDAALEVLAIIMSNENVSEYNRLIGWMPFKNACLEEDPFFTEDEHRAMFVYSVENGHTFFPQHAQVSAIRDATTKMLQTVYTELVTSGSISDDFIREQMDKCATEVNAMLKE